MSERAIRAIWSFLGLLSAAFAFSAILRVTGSDPENVIIPFGSYGHRSVTILAIPLGSAVLLPVLWLTRRYPKREPDRGLASRMPTFYFEADDVRPEHAEGRLYQLIFFAGFIAMPTLVQLFLFRKFLASGITTPVGLHFTNWLEHFWPAMSIDWQEVFRGNYNLERVSYYPLLLPWGFLLIEVVVVYQFCLTLRHLLRAANPGAAPDGERAAHVAAR
jgi:hypothetical protein